MEIAQAVYRIQWRVCNISVRFADNIQIVIKLKRFLGRLVCLLTKNNLNPIRRKADTFY